MGPTDGPRPRRAPAATHAGSSLTDLRDHLSAVGRFWRSASACVVVCVALALVLTWRAEPQYQTSTTFFASSATQGDSSALQADEFAQRRVNSYVGVVRSERMAREVIADTGLELSPATVISKIQASVDPDTVLLNVQVIDSSRERSLAIARAITANLGRTIADLDSGQDSATVQLQDISGPTVAAEPVSPRPVLNLAVGLLLGLVLAIGQAIVRQQLDTTLRTREELVAATRHPVLGLVNRDPGFRRTPVLVSGSAHSRRAESFRQLRTGLRFIDAAEKLEVLVVTSSVESEGKTTTATNLAVSFAEAGYQVLLVDGDLRKPKLEDYLDLEASAGLTSILIGEAEFDDVAQEWGEYGLQVLACGPVPPNPSELLGSSGMEKLLAELRSRFELIIIDSPPLLPVTDAAILSTYATGAILVVRHGSTRRDHVQRSVESLESVDAHLLGSVLTMAPDVRRDRQPAYYRETGPGH
ncbi:MAG: polysaccharide biosynthesis tyrosine autokinase [Nocardioidaceae bacterium]|nr:polysaccharide biosynthesis tyrosine autokinase [Nocardioidaceae bacterium]